jgi:enamine deaminase RidA (YjgF/YER057c/UK114 family)
MINRKSLQPENVWVPTSYPYSHAVSANAGRLLFISGQVALDPDLNYVGIGDIAAQTHQVFKNLGHVLASVGADFSHVLDLTSFIVGRENLPAHLEAMKEIYAQTYPKADYPADSAILVAGLYREEFLLEVKAVAALPA